ncbi:site-2 protease family protein [Candidatus Peregrinibacteria bacterium]|nr:site-2 protease family protein [Candidatus Peregrinibacteria bacterium]
MMNFISSVIAIIFAVTIHEFSHAWAADRLGDPTARIYGRLTLNPLKHFDFVGTLSLIIFGIGWGKPVPFNPENLRYPKRDSALVALAGPVSNLLTALVFAIPLKYLGSTSFVRLPLYGLIGNIFAISILLFSLNILPFPPFDGSKIIGLFIPHHWHAAYENYLRDGVKYVILFILFDVLVLEKILGFSILHFIVVKITTWIIAVISLGT